jgi:hypothetical protein
MMPSKRTACFLAAGMTAICNLVLVWCRTKAEIYLGIFWFGAAHGAIYVVQCSMARVLADMRIAAAFFGLVRVVEGRRRRGGEGSKWRGLDGRCLLSRRVAARGPAARPLLCCLPHSRRSTR